LQEANLFHEQIGFTARLKLHTKKHLQRY
jgi:hypothetical protein